MLRSFQILIAFLGLLVVVATVVPWIRATAWWIRVFDFPRPQMMVVGLLVLLCAPFLGTVRWWPHGAVLLLVAFCVVYQGWRIFPYTPLAPFEALSAAERAPGRTFSLLVANVYMENRNAEGMLDLVRRWQPDVVLLTEPDAWWQEQLQPLEPDYPWRVLQPQNNTYGMLLYSKLPLEEPRIEELLEKGIPSIHTRLTLPEGISLNLHGLHPRPPAPQHAEDSLERDAELLVAARRVQASGSPVILIGDLNDVAWSRTTRLMQKISGLLDPRKGRGLFNTFHAGNPLLRWPLDHVFHTPHFKVVRLERLPAFGSDHFPIFAELVFDGRGLAEQEPPRPTVEEADEAQETIEEAQ